MVLLSDGDSRISNYRKCPPPPSPGKNDSNQYQPTLRNPFVSRWRLQKLSTRFSAVIYYTAFSFCLFLRTLRNIFPLADFGIWSTNSTPPLSFLCGATREDKNSMISSAVTSPRRTTKAFGTSPASGSGTPITAASSIFG